MLEFLYPPLDWQAWRDDWPLTRYSQFVESTGLRWHVQTMGQGPVMLLLHGTGASTHSWRDLVPRWANDFTVVSVDLPGHAFSPTDHANVMTLQGMAQALQRLMTALRLEPHVIVGHSAGAAVGAEMVLKSPPGAKPLLVGLNPAWLPMPGWAGLLFAPAAKLAHLNPLSAWMMAKQASVGSCVERVLVGTGSHLSPQGVSYYKRILSQPVHVRGVLRMMVGWDLTAWSPQLEQLDSPVLMVCGADDRTVSPDSTLGLAQRLRHAERVVMSGLGHLAHEEAPVETARKVTEWVVRADAGRGR